jgi:hypothetical protein
MRRTFSRGGSPYAVTQPYDVNVLESLVGPRKGFPEHV